MICGEIVKPTNKLVFPFQRMDSAYQTFDNALRSLGLLKHRSVCISQKVKAQKEGPPCPAMDFSVDILTTDHGPSHSKNNFKHSSAAYGFF